MRGVYQDGQHELGLTIQQDLTVFANNFLRAASLQQYLNNVCDYGAFNVTVYIINKVYIQLLTMWNTLGHCS